MGCVEHSNASTVTALPDSAHRLGRHQIRPRILTVSLDRQCGGKPTREPLISGAGTRREQLEFQRKTNKVMEEDGFQTPSPAVKGMAVARPAVLVRSGSMSRAEGASADCGSRYGRHGGGVVALYRDGSAGPSSRISARDS